MVPTTDEILQSESRVIAQSLRRTARAGRARPRARQTVAYERRPQAPVTVSRSAVAAAPASLAPASRPNGRLQLDPDTVVRVLLVRRLPERVHEIAEPPRPAPHPAPTSVDLDVAHAARPVDRRCGGRWVGLRQAGAPRRPGSRRYRTLPSRRRADRARPIRPGARARCDTRRGSRASGAPGRGRTETAWRRRRLGAASRAHLAIAADRRAPTRCRLVPGAGIEPARPKPKDFKSLASTSFATRARVRCARCTTRKRLEAGVGIEPAYTALQAAA